MRVDWKPKKQPWDAPDYDDDVIYAIRALSAGTAHPHQQQLAWEWFQYITTAGEMYADLSFRPGPDGQRATDFAEGKRWVGMQVRKMLYPGLTKPTTTTTKK